MRRRNVALLVIALAACARVMSPTGGDPDRSPPAVVQTIPEQNALATQLAGREQEVRIVFDETISERSPREMVMVSPETGEVDVDRDGNVLKVKIEGGWQPNRVYRVTVLPGLVDRFGNARPTTYELVFSTGATIPQNAVGGIVTDRITGRPVGNARVEVISRADSTVFTTVTDSMGFYAVRALPPGAYDTRVYVDQNRNRELDAAEATAAQPVNVASVNDTIAIELSLLVHDTTPARLTRADIRDSLQVRLSFDDYTDPVGGLPPMRITAWQLPDSTMIAGGSIMTPREFDALRAARGDTARADTINRQLPSPRAPTPRPPVQRPPPGIATPAADTSRVLPVNELVWVPVTPLRPSTRYRITISGYRNLAGIPNGGGSVVVTSPAPPRAAPVLRPDTTRQ
jgi:hypothetical protein